MGKRNSVSNKLNFTLESISALNKKQEKVLREKGNQVLIGAAGTGKTFLASWLAFHALDNSSLSQVVYIRSAVPTRDIGFLPGTENDKMMVYKAPYKDICKTLYNKGDAYEILEKKGIVSFMPTSFVRGTTIRNSFVIVDECQNMTMHELDSIITRLDDNSKIIFCGDIAQADLKNNGFAEFFNIIKGMEEFSVVEFTTEDIVRGGLVKSYLTRKEALSSHRS